MKRIVLCLLLCVSVLFGCSPENESNTEKTADFTVYNTEMKEVKLSEFFGKPIIVNFWATWCPPCREELPSFDNMYKKHGDDVSFLMINLTDGLRDTIDGVNSFIENYGYTFPIYYDIDYNASDVYEVYSIPETLFINSDGSLFDIKVGMISEVALERYIKQIID